MGGIVKAVTNVVKDVAEEAVKAGKVVAGVTVKVGGVVLKAASPITGPVVKAIRSGLDATLGRVLPDSVYSKISGLTGAAAVILEGNTTPSAIKNAVMAVINIYLVQFRINREMLNWGLKQGVISDIDKYSGGVLTSARNLSQVPVTMHEGGKIDWRATAIDAIKVGLAVGAAGTASAVVVGSNYVGDKTGINKTSLGQGILTASALIATGQASFSGSLGQGATTVGTKAAINNTALGDSSLGRAVATIGVSASVQSIQTNEAFSQIMRDKAEAELRAFAEKKADKEIRDATGGVLTLDLVTKGYDIATSDKTLSQFIDEAKEKYTQKFDELVKKAEGITEEKMKEKASAEADRFLQKRLDEAYKLAEKYGEKLAGYLFKKYGPQTDYDTVIQPDDFLNYQIDITKEGDRLTRIVYKESNGLKIAGGIALVGIAVAGMNLTE